MTSVKTIMQRIEFIRRMKEKSSPETYDMDTFASAAGMTSRRYEKELEGSSEDLKLKAFLKMADMLHVDSNMLATGKIKGDYVPIAAYMPGSKTAEKLSFMMELIDYFSWILCWKNSDIEIYCNGHRYIQAREVASNKARRTVRGIRYYDAGEADVTLRIEDCDPESITVVFDGRLCETIKNPAVTGRLNEIGGHYGCQFRQDSPWNLSFYKS